VKQYLPSVHGALGLIPNNALKKKKRTNWNTREIDVQMLQMVQVPRSRRRSGTMVITYAAFQPQELFFFGHTGVWTQGLHLEPLHQSFSVMGFFEIGSHIGSHKLTNYLPELASNCNPLPLPPE
jgi:hypothetical protein